MANGAVKQMKIGKFSKSLPRIRAYISEFVGMFFFLFFSVGIAVATVFNSQVNTLKDQQNYVSVPLVLQIAFGFGMMIMILAYTLGQYSGAHFNPAVTVGLCIFGKITVWSAFVYILCQCGGAIFGVFCVKLFFPARAAEAINYGLNQPTCPEEGLCVSSAMAVAVEAMGTMLLVYVVYGTAVDKNNDKGLGHMAPVPIGFTVFLCHVMLIPLTGCGINPARSLGSAVVALDFNKFWIFVVGPLAGGIVGAALHFIPLQYKNQPKEYSEEAQALAVVDEEKELERQQENAEVAREAEQNRSRNDVEGGRTPQPQKQDTEDEFQTPRIALDIDN